ncbi:hypothetical protein GCM10011579_020040 [Streptomyces albiflavescens]|uniref:Uncharacterized protein n=1 Tax=Streptomyces albiflavescens TaxID=1623582 RepID=A0A917XWZ2_9ACTN|nr:hypothetical protein GCM10011579_020040 [Streptomyces albiflavescens]
MGMLAEGAAGAGPVGPKAHLAGAGDAAPLPPQPQPQPRVRTGVRPDIPADVPTWLNAARALASRPTRPPDPAAAQTNP